MEWQRVSVRVQRGRESQHVIAGGVHIARQVLEDDRLFDDVLCDHEADAVLDGGLGPTQLLIHLRALRYTQASSGYAPSTFLTATRDPTP